MREMLVRPDEGRVADMGNVTMRVLAAGDDAGKGAFTLAEFVGGAGAWTVPHIHQAMEESFFVLDGDFTFTFGEEPVAAGKGAYILIPRDTRHTIRAEDGGGRLLTLMVPGGLEEMFFELAQLPPGAITDPKVRAAISAKYDSIPS
jgi:quercetin dioxygenase-like cupin family protein